MNNLLKEVVGRCRTTVFLKFTCSAGAEHLFFSFSCVRQVPNSYFFRFHSFGTCRTSIFLVFGCSAGAERMIECLIFKIFLTILLSTLFKWLCTQSKQEIHRLARREIYVIGIKYKCHAVFSRTINCDGLLPISSINSYSYKPAGHPMIISCRW